MEHIIAIDPGGTTGIATRSSKGYIQTSDLVGEHHLALWRELNEQMPNVVVWERFLYQRRELDKGVSLVLDSREYIGVCKLWVQVNKDLTKGIEQTPAQRTFWDDTALKRLFKKRLKHLHLPLSLPGSPHQRDALRHLFFYMLMHERSTDAVRELLEVGKKD